MTSTEVRHKVSWGLSDYIIDVAIAPFFRIANAATTHTFQRAVSNGVDCRRQWMSHIIIELRKNKLK